jgi:hypothetical protein
VNVSNNVDTRNNLEINETNLPILYNLAVLEKVALETPVADVSYVTRSEYLKGFRF